MKKKIILIAVLFLFVLTGCTKSNVEEISYSKFKDKIKNNESFILEVMQDGCKFCESYAPKFDKILKEYNITAYKLNLTKLNEKDDKEFKTAYFITGTPTTMFIVDGKDTTGMLRIDGDQSEAKIIEKLKANGYIKNEEK